MAIKCPKCQSDNPETAAFCADCGTKITSPKDIGVTKTIITPETGLQKGSTFAERYQLIEELGRGGMGVVYKAEDTKLKRTVALKFLPPELTHIPDVKDRFMREAQAAAALDHPNICTVYEFDEAEEKTFISMAYIEGQSLRKKLESGPLELEEALRNATQIADGLQEAHKNGVIHRDIKSTNIMLDKRDQAKIMDFGLARMTGTTLLTQEGTAMGTVAYMSPEQARGKEVDHRTDIWSFGVVLYEMLTGELPFKGEHEQAVVFAIRKDKPKPITEVKAEIPQSIEQVVEKALEKDADKRYQQVDELLDDLKSISVGIVPEEIKARLRKAKLQKQKRAILYAGAVGSVIILVVFGSILLKGPSETIDSIAVLPLENLTGDMEKQYVVDGVTDQLIGKLGQISGLKRVTSRTTVMQYKETEKSLPDIARKLNVDALVEGTVYQVGESIQVRFQLFDALPEEQNLWSKTYERPMSDVLIMYSEVAQEIARKIKIGITQEEETRFAGTRQVNPESYDNYLKGLPHLKKFTPEGTKIAQQYFELALEIDPNNALAHVGMANVWALSHRFGMTPVQEAMPLQKAAIDKALELDNTLAEAHSALADHRVWREWDWEGAEKAFQQALRLNPNLADAHGGYAQFLCIMGRPKEALTHMELAIELDPLDSVRYLWYATVLGANHRYDDAIAACRTAMEMTPNLNLLAGIGAAYEAKGMYDEALALYRKQFADDAEATAALEDGFKKAGYKGAARAVADLLAERYGKPGETGWRQGISNWYIRAGDYELAIDWLEKAYENNERSLLLIGMPKGNPLHDEALRSNPRFQELLRKMNLPVELKE